jgi:hypothetical protein
MWCIRYYVQMIEKKRKERIKRESERVFELFERLRA